MAMNTGKKINEPVIALTKTFARSSDPALVLCLLTADENDDDG